MRQIELLRCVEEWDQVLSKSQNNNKQLRCDDSTLSKSALANSSSKAADHSSSSNHKNSKNAFNKTSSDSQKKQHCDEQQNKVTNSAWQTFAPLKDSINFVITILFILPISSLQSLISQYSPVNYRACRISNNVFETFCT